MRENNIGIRELLKNKFSPLHIATQQNKVELAELLLEANADKNARDDEGIAPIHIACELYHKEIVDLLIKYEADINAKDPKGDTPLHIACEWNQVEIVKILIDAGADVKAKNSEGLTPLDLTQKKNQIYNIYPQELVKINKDRNEEIIKLLKKAAAKDQFTTFRSRTVTKLFEEVGPQQGSRT